MLHPLHRPWVSWEVANASASYPGCYQPWLIEGGWGAVREQIDAAYAMGFRVMFIHRPFGEAQGGASMAGDSRVRLMGDKVAGRLIKGYDAFQSSLLRDHPDVHLVCYLGHIFTLRPRLDAGDVTGWLDHLRRSYLPLLDADRVHIGLDYASTYKLDSPEWRACELLAALLRARGRECVIESLPAEERGMFGFVHEPAYREHKGKLRIPDRGFARWYSRAARYVHKLDARAYLADCKATGAAPCIDWTLIASERLAWEDFA